MQQVYREVDGQPQQVLVDLGYAKHQVACDRAQRLVDAGLSKRNIAVDINGRLVARLPAKKCGLLLVQFPAISEPGAYWMTTHTWRDEQGDPNPPPPPPPAPQTEWPIPEISAQALVEVFGEHNLYPTNNEAGYFARRQRGQLGASASGALAIIAGMTSLKGTQAQLLNRANRITCERYPAWWRYGLSDGWDGLPINRQEPEQRDPRLWDQYAAGYAVGREAAQLLGLPVPDEPRVITNREEYLDHYQPASWARIGCSMTNRRRR
jgi:hypothetical protein